MMDRFIEKGGKTLRYGYTTGSCATAAAKAATLLLLTGERVDYMTIDTPKGWHIDIEIINAQLNSDYAVCSVIKDGGDDPDVTNGIEVVARVSYANEAGVYLEGGKGVGIVTKKGLSVPVGEAAINPVPRRMIIEEVSQLLEDHQGVNIEISVPRGEVIAKRTFNEKLGILGGISILGTSGIVEPMSEEAMAASLRVELSVKRAEGIEAIIYVFGNFGRDYVLSQWLENEAPYDKLLQKTSNFVGHMMKAAAELGIKRILYVGHAGKMVKVAAGMNNTHSKYGDNRMRSILACAKGAWELGNQLPWLSQDEQKQLLNANTTDEAVEILKVAGCEKEVFAEVANRCKKVCEKMSGGQVTVACLIFSNIHGLLGETEDVKEMRQEIL